MKRSKGPAKRSKKSTSEKRSPSAQAVVAAVNRSSYFVLNIMKEAETNPVSTQPATEEKRPLAPTNRSLPENVPVLDPKPILARKAYSVLWAKKSTRKQKKWEGCGILEVAGRCGIVKDEQGTRIGHMSNLRTELIVPGIILPAGRVDIEIKDLIPAGSQKVIAVKPIHTEETPGAKQSLSRPYKYQRGLANLLIMPKPSNEHESVFNTRKARVNDVTVTYCLAKVLRAHQRLGVVFMYGCVTGISHINRFGCILADEMGMGKTLQCITLIWTLLHQGPYGGTPLIKKALIVTPHNLSTVWEKEFYRWLGRSRIRVFVANSKKPFELSTSRHPIYIISYEMFVRHFEEVSKLSFDLMICDEGHRLKTTLNKAASFLTRLPCKRRIILTAAPIHNDLQDFFRLCDFVNPGCLGSNEEYTNHFVVPILESRESTANNQAISLGLARSTELTELTSSFILRRSHDVLGAYIPTKTETVVFCRSSALQQDLYAATVEAWNNRHNTNKNINHLSVIQMLKKICNHPSLILQDIQGSELVFPGSLRSLMCTESILKLEDSGKVRVLLSLLQCVAANDEKIVIVSSHTQTLGMLANLCEVKDFKYVQLDGNIPLSKTLSIVTSFNSPWNKIFVFLLSADASGRDFNLAGVSRLVLFDKEWNSATDLQIMSRIWKDGQKYSVYIYRFISTGTIEENIYQKQLSNTELDGTAVTPANTSSIQFSDEELKDIFEDKFYEHCATHSLLKCTCNCDGTVPESHIVKDVCSQLDKTSTSDNSANLKIKLMKLEHHKPPFEGKNVEALFLNDSYADINFMMCEYKF